MGNSSSCQIEGANTGNFVTSKVLQNIKSAKHVKSFSALLTNVIEIVTCDFFQCHLRIIIPINSMNGQSKF